jgi:hypothetical protein
MRRIKKDREEEPKVFSERVKKQDEREEKKNIEGQGKI